MIVVAIIGLLAAIAVPNFVKARNTAQANACKVNMKQIENAIEQWAVENGMADSDTVDKDQIKKYIKGNLIPTCPSGKKDYTVGPNVNSDPIVRCPNENSDPKHLLRNP